jgi:hypothetical protein
MLVLAIACLLLGIGAPRLVGALQQAIAAFAASPTPVPIATNRAWLVAPGGIAQVSPLLLAVLLVAVIVVAAAAVRSRGLVVRRADTWGCGRIRQTPRMEYTSAAFAEPLRRVFSELYRPSEDLSISAHPGSRYFVREISYTARVVPWFEHVFYDPAIRSVRTIATRVRRLQAGSIHLYLLYVTVALLVALTAAWGVR